MTEPLASENDQNRQEIVQEWLLKAESDFRTVTREAAVLDQPSYETVCFHAQQCIEKLLKAVLLQNKQMFPKTHDLGQLAQLLRPFYPALDLSRESLEFLTDIGIQCRYPGFHVAEKDVQDALAACLELRVQLKGLIL